MKFTHNNNEYELILLHLAGSKLYGNSTPASDTDYRGVFIASKESKLGILGTVEQLEGKDVWKSLVAAGLELEPTDDIVVYELNRFVALAIENNPNIMDTLCFNYNSSEFTVYANEKGKELIDNKSLFISSKLKFTFSGYAISQLQRIKSHNKWLGQFPDINTVMNVIQKQFDTGRVDWDWLCDNFGGNVAAKVTGETAQKHNKLDETISWSLFAQIFDDSRLNCSEDFDIDRYRLPRLIDYCHPKDLKSKQYDLNDRQYMPDTYYTNSTLEKLTLKEFLYKKASFRTFSPSMLAIYEDGKGIFTKDGNLNPNDPETIGDFVCLLSIDQNKFKSDRDYINKLWEWKCNRNEKRNELEEKFGYDTKHASHLVRLMEGAKDILNDGDYNPTLFGDRLQLVKDTRAGKFTYEELIAYSERLDNELNEMYKTSKLQKKPNTKAINTLVLKLQEC